MKTQLVCLAMALACVSLSAAELPPVALTFDGATVSVANLTPNATAVLFGGGRVPLQSWMDVYEWSYVLHADANGAASATISVNVPVQSVWAVVEVDSGRTGIAAPQYSPFRPVALPNEVLKRGNSGHFERYESGRLRVDALIVRPHVGAWTFAGGDGLPGDGDGQGDGRTTIAFGNMTRLTGNAPAPAHLTPHDIVVIIDPQRLQYASSEVTE